jgi:RHS repeat-associated protein
MMDYFGARYYASVQGRFTSIDPIYITKLRLIDPQQINLYHYARNNPLRFTDPTGEDIDDTILKDNDEYQKWKKAFLATKSGREQWDKYDKDRSFTLKITMGENSGGKQGAQTKDYVFNADGKLTGATIVLGTEFAQNAPSGDNYPVSSSLTPTADHAYDISREARAVAFLGHEFGHVGDAQRIGGAEWQRQNDLLSQSKAGFERYGQGWFNRSEYQQIVSGLGATPVEINHQREVRAERTAIPIIQDYFSKGAGHGDIPKRVQQAIQNYQKSHP